MGLRDLVPGRFAIATHATYGVQDLPPLPLPRAIANSLCVTTTHHQRVPSVPLDLTQNHNLSYQAPHSLQSMRPSECHRKSRLAFRRRTLWGLSLPSANTHLGYVPVTPALAVNGSTVKPPDPSLPTARGITSEGSADAGAVLSLSSDSGVDVVEHDTGHSSSSTLVETHASSYNQCTRRRRPLNTRRAHVVSAFEQSLSNMSKRLQTLTHTTAKKDSELHELRATIDALRSQSGLPRSNLETDGMTNGENIAQAGVCENHTSHTNNECATEGSPQKKSFANSKSTSSGLMKKNSWLRTSIGKAFRKKSLTFTSANTTSDIQEVTNKIAPDAHESCGWNHPDIIHGHLLTATSCDRQGIQRNSNEGFQATAVPVCGHNEPPHTTTSNFVATTNPKSGEWDAPVQTDDSAHSSEAILSPRHSVSSQRPRTTTDCHGSSSITTGTDAGKPHRSDPAHLHPHHVQRQGGLAPHHEAQSKIQQQQQHQFDETTSLLPARSSPTFTSEKTNTSHMTALQAELVRLRVQLSERESELSDVQLEALSSTHKVNELREQMGRMIDELERLRVDNERLQQHVTNQNRHDDTLASNSHVDDTANELCLHEQMQSGRLSEMKWNLFDHLTRLLVIPSTHDSSTPRILASVKSIWHVDLEGGSDHVVWEWNLGVLDLSASVEWHDLDCEVVRLYGEYVRGLDPNDTLTLDSTVPVGYRLRCKSAAHTLDHWHRVEEAEINPPAPSLASLLSEHHSPDADPMDLVITTRRIKDDFPTDVSLHSLVPPQALERCLDLMEQRGCVILCPMATSSTHFQWLHLAIADCMKRSNRVSRIVRFDICSDATDANAQLEQILASYLVHDFHPDGPVTGPAHVLLMGQLNRITVEDFSHILTRVGWHTTRRQQSDKRLVPKLYLLCTVSNPSMDTVHNNVDCVGDTCDGSTDSDPIHAVVNEQYCVIRVGFRDTARARVHLARRLRQRLIHMLVQQSIETPDRSLDREEVMFLQKLTDWLQELWVQLNRLYQRHSDQCTTTTTTTRTLSTDMFDDMPLLDTETWFVERCWNQSIVIPHDFLLCVRSSGPDDRSIATDALAWMTDTWPWTENQTTRATQTHRLRTKPWVS